MDKINLYISFIFCQVLFFVSPALAQDDAGSNIASRTKLQNRGKRYLEQRVYDNGLGDIVQEVQSFPGTSCPDITVKHEYDECRRKTKTWLPVTDSSNSGYISNDVIANMAVSQHNDTDPFSLTVYDGFLPTLPSAQYKAGHEWQNNDKKISISYSEYTGVGIFIYDDTLTFTYPDIKYLCTHYIDEDGCSTAEYTDVTGRRKISETSQGKTYYVYNDKGDICYVIPPALSEYIISYYGVESEDILDSDEMVQKYAYIYRYDYRRNCIYKKLPGCDPIYYVYDKAGNCIFTQDGNQRLRNEWTYNIPDKFGRPAISGVCHNNISYSLDPMQQNPLPVHIYAEYDGGSSSSGGYTVRNYSLVSQTLYSASYYDNYSFIGHHGVPSSLSSSIVTGFSIDPSIGKGLKTGDATAYFNENGVVGYLYSAMYYDSRYNVSQAVATNHLGRCDRTSTNYSYTEKPTNMVINHNLQTRGELEKYTYTYDNADRLSKVSHTMDNGSEITLQQNSYNGLGQLESSSNGIYTTAYTYDMHSWLKSISTRNQSILFEESLKYADSDHPCYNGNISAMTWQSNGSGTQRYNYIYDDASRLISSSYTVGNSSNRYSTQYSYDCMGNITSLRRYGLLDDGSYGLIDDLTLSYDGNQLTAVSDDGDDPTYNNVWNFMDGADSEIEYEYDANGNITKDLNRNILSIQYNSLNLPSVIEFADGKTIKYTYSADGHKLRAVYTTATPATTKQIDYCGNLIFENGQLQQINVEGGYVTYVGSLPAYHHYIKDHLGNNRMVIHPSGLNMQPQVNNYYPYGGLMANSTQHNQQRYKYNGKELDRMHGLDWYDYGARWMDASIGRWHSIDPLCEDYYDVTPYGYCKGDPINQFDPDGRAIETVWDLVNLGADITSLRNNLKQGNYGAAAVDVLATIIDGAAVALPGIPGGAGVTIKGVRSADRTLDAVSTVKNARSGSPVPRYAVHGNSKASERAQHAYDIIDKRTGKVVKTGVSGGKIRKDGKSYRAESQVRKWNKVEGGDFYESKITHTEPAGPGARDKIYKYEKSRSDILREKGELDQKKHQRP